MRKSNCVYAQTAAQNNRAVFAYAVLFLITIVSVGYIVHESVHVCSGEDCPVCACIRSVKNNLLQLKIYLAETAYVAAPSYERVEAVIYFYVSAFCLTLVSQKIKLNN
ncbi:hypothetical protein [Treponema socranskii]|uniref:hypothetical protein n=1 Tax=Treponema socranskii TaxID=53419 RepID=UPI003D6DCAFC